MKRRCFLFILLVVVPLVFTVPANAQLTIVPDVCQDGSPTKCGICELTQGLKNITDILIALSSLLAAAFLVWAGFMFMTAMGSEERVSNARKIATSTVTGLVIVLVSWLLINTLLNVAFQADIAPWNDIDCSQLTLPSGPTPPSGGPPPGPTPQPSSCTIEGLTVPHSKWGILDILRTAKDPNVQKNIDALWIELLKASNLGYVLQLNSLYRPLSYQQHLWEIMDRWNVCQSNTNPSCNLLCKTITNLKNQHGLTGVVAKPSSNAPHVRGVAIDMVAQGISNAAFAQLLQKNNINICWPNIPGDAVHYELCTPPYAGPNTQND